jgi:predicted DNA-binding protein (UPF0251 family)
MCRRVWCEPGVTFFKPAGVPMTKIEEVTLTMEEFESIRLMDHEGLRQVEAAEKMNVSQPTFQRVYESARKKIADSLVNGKAIRIDGGHYRFMGRRPGRGFGRGRRFQVVE